MGAERAERLATDVACLVIVDVLSFTTSVTVAMEAGTRVYPYRWRDESVSVFAGQVNADLAAGRRAATGTPPWSLPPAALHRAPFTLDWPVTQRVSHRLRNRAGGTWSDRCGEDGVAHVRGFRMTSTGRTFIPEDLLAFTSTPRL